MSEWLQINPEVLKYLFYGLKSKLFPRGGRTQTPRLLNLYAHEEDRPFDDPPLPRCARGVPRARSSQVGTLKPRSCISTTLANPNG